MPAIYLEKYFGKSDFKVTNPALQKKTRGFLAKQLKVKPESISFGDKGQIILNRQVTGRLLRTDLNDKTFLTDGGKSAALYEGVEMAYNDVMAGTVQAGGSSFTGRIREVVQKGVEMLPASVTETVAKLRDSGGLQVLGALGIGGTVGIGLWLGAVGAKQVSQGLARSDSDQALSGARHMFMGTESLMTGAAIASEMGTHTLLKTAGQVARTLAAPMAIANGVVDIVQGTKHIRDGIRKKDGLAGAEGLAELGMGVGWLAAGFGATPAVVAVSCACLAAKLGIVVVRSRQKRKAEKARMGQDGAILEQMLPQGASNDKEYRLSESESRSPITLIPNSHRGPIPVFLDEKDEVVVCLTPDHSGGSSRSPSP